MLNIQSLVGMLALLGLPLFHVGAEDGVTAAPTAASPADAAPLEVLGEVRAHSMTLVESIVNWMQGHYTHLLFMFAGIAISLLIGLIVNKLFSVIVVRFLAKRTAAMLDDLLFDAIRPAFCGMIVTLGIYLSVLIVLGNGATSLNQWGLRLFFAAEAAMIFWGCWRALNVVDYLLRRAIKTVNPEMDELGLSLINTSIKTALLILEVLFIGQTILGMNISAMIAGAGVAGLALALASKESVANFFGSLMLALDRPFSVGDRVRTMGVDGTIERVGFRSTAIRQLSGSLYSVPNSMISGIGIENLSRQAFLKHVFEMTLTNTKPSQVGQVKEIMGQLLAHHPFQDPERPMQIHFKAFANWTMTLEFAVIFVNPNLRVVQNYLEEVYPQIVDRLTQAEIQVSIPPVPSYLPY